MLQPWVGGRGMGTWGWWGVWGGRERMEGSRKGRGRRDDWGDEGEDGEGDGGRGGMKGWGARMERRGNMELGMEEDDGVGRGWGFGRMRKGVVEVWGQQKRTERNGNVGMGMRKRTEGFGDGALRMRKETEGRGRAAALLEEVDGGTKAIGEEAVPSAGLTGCPQPVLGKSGLPQGPSEQKVAVVAVDDCDVGMALKFGPVLGNYSCAAQGTQSGSKK